MQKYKKVGGCNQQLYACQKTPTLKLASVSLLFPLNHQDQKKKTPHLFLDFFNTLPPPSPKKEYAQKCPPPPPSPANTASSRRAGPAPRPLAHCRCGSRGSGANTPRRFGLRLPGCQDRSSEKSLEILGGKLQNKFGNVVSCP